MGKDRRIGKKSGGPRAPAARPLTAQQLYEQAQFALRYDDLDSARTALKKAAKLEPSNLEIVEALGALLADIGPEDEALLVLRHAVSLSPEQGYMKYMYLGQLLDGQEALAATRKGVSVLQAEQAAAVAEAAAAAAGAEAKAKAKELSSALCAARCSLAEMLLGEAGEDVTPVAAEVEQLLAQAAQADPTSAEPGQALASLRAEQGRSEEALAALRQSMALWYTPSARDEEEDEGGCDAAAGAAAMKAEGAGAEADEDTSMEGSSEEEDDDEEDEDAGPSYEFRVECVKLLLELDESTVTAIDVLESLIEEDDRVPDAWHLLALAYYSGHQYTEAAEVLAKGVALVQALGAGPEDEITQTFQDLGEAIQEALAASQAGGAGAG